MRVFARLLPSLGLIAASAAPAAPFFVSLPRFPLERAIAEQVSADGFTVVGVVTGDEPEAFRWNPFEGVVGLGDLAGGEFRSRADAASSDGLVVVGAGADASGTRASRWTQATGVVALDESMNLGAEDVSADGSVVVGSMRDALGNDEAVRWTEATGAVGLGDLPGGFHRSYARAVSADGSVVVGRATGTGRNYEAFLWTAADGLVGLGDPWPDFDLDSEALGISADGRVIVGAAGSTLPGSFAEAFRWTAEEGMVSLGDLPGGDTRGSAWDASADGSVIVGRGATGFDPGDLTPAPESIFEAFYWDAENGMRRLQDVLEQDHGLDLTGWTLTLARAVSDDGRTIVGDAMREGASFSFVAKLDPACSDGADDDGDGLADFPEDPECTSPFDPSERPACSDGLDNDGDGLFDHPGDPGCFSALNRDESPACDDGEDNDGDGAADWDGAGIGAADPECEASPWLDREGPACGLGFELALLAAAVSALRRRSGS